MEYKCVTIKHKIQRCDMIAFLFLLTFWHETPAMATDDDIAALVWKVGRTLKSGECVSIDFTERPIWWRLRICKVKVKVVLGKQAMFTNHIEEEVELL